jgi:hypothetical protein
LSGDVANPRALLLLKPTRAGIRTNVVKQRHPELLGEFSAVVSVASLDRMTLTRGIGDKAGQIFRSFITGERDRRAMPQALRGPA